MVVKRVSRRKVSVAAAALGRLNGAKAAGARAAGAGVVNAAAQALGRLGGKATSEAKTAACRENARKGGWPKGRPRKVKVEP